MDSADRVGMRSVEEAKNRIRFRGSRPPGQSRSFAKVKAFLVRHTLIWAKYSSNPRSRVNDAAAYIAAAVCCVGVVGLQSWQILLLMPSSL